jgi:hypothetical protein
MQDPGLALQQLREQLQREALHVRLDSVRLHSVLANFHK